MVRVFNILFLAALLLGGAAVAIAGFALDERPWVAAGPQPTVADLERLQRLAEAHDPRRLREGQRRSISLTERDLNLWIEHGLRRLPGADGIRVRTGLGHDRALLTASLPVPASALGRYLNLHAELGPAPDGLTLERLAVGGVTVPAPLARPLLELALAGAPAGLRAEIRDARDAITGVALGPGQLTLDVMWRRDLVDRLAAQGRDLVLPAAERGRLVAYFNRVSTLAATHGRAGVSLSEYLRPVFALATLRSRDAAAAGENASALLALALHASGRRSAVVRLLGPDAGALAPPVRFAPTLRGRVDLAQHFLVSAALTAAAGTALADALGVFKEVDDSRGGSGFSFADLAADRAGVRLAERAISAPEETQRRLAAVRGEAAFMPAVDRLPEGLSERAFKARFADRESAAYRLMMAEIERRIDAALIHR